MTTPAPDFAPRLGLTSATTLVMGSMIGSGIFIVSAEIARLTGSPALLMGAWLVTAVLTIVGALCFAELAAMMPHAGGQYVFLRESLGPLWGFLYGWTFFLVIQTGTIAAVAVAFGKFLGVFFPAVSARAWLWHIAHVPSLAVGPVVLGNMEVGLNTQNAVAIAVVLLLSLLNALGVRAGAAVQNVFTFAKVAALLGLVGVGLVLGANGAAAAANFGDFWRGLGGAHPLEAGAGGATVWVGALTVVAVAQVGSLFSADAWNNVTFAAAEVERPSRNLPLALGLGTGVVLLLYLACNLTYLAVLPLHGDPAGATAFARGIAFAAEDRVGTAVMQQALGSLGGALMAAAVLVSTFGCDNGLILAGARVGWAMARDGLFFASAGRLHARFRTPTVALAAQALWATVLCLSGSYGQLLDYIIFAVLLFYVLTLVGLFVLRWRRPEAPRPYRALGYPVLPALYIVVALGIDGVLLRYKPQYTWPGLFIVLSGIPVYFLWRRASARGPRAYPDAKR